MFSKTEAISDNACELSQLLKSANMGEEGSAWSLSLLLVNKDGGVVNRRSLKATLKELDSLIAELMATS